MTTDMTYNDACQVIADTWNETDSETKFTGKEIFELHPDGELFWLSYLYEVAKNGKDALIGLLLSDDFYAQLFCMGVERKKGQN
jgi:hypothetical protein